MLKTFTIEPEGDPRGTVIWLHGLGASNHDFDDLVPVLGLPGVRYVFPAAPVQPVTINGGYPMPSWYDIVSGDDPPLREHEPDVRRSAEQIVELIHEQAEHGVDARRIVLAGFSQGGAMALHVGLRHPEALAGIMVLSGYQVIPQCFASERSAANRNTPILFCHGVQDSVVPLRLARQAYAAVKSEGYLAEFHEFNMPHSICQEEIPVIGNWLRGLALYPDFVYKIVSVQQWEQAMAEGEVAPNPDDARDGFIHLSTAAQIPATRDKHFAGQSDLVLLTIRSAALRPTLRFEPSRNGELFPHLFGALPVSAVEENRPL